jgi:hypothetical protein
MKKLVTFVHGIPHKLRDYWQHRWNHSRHCHMSRGAEYIRSMVTFAHGDGWRRKERKK